MMYCSMCKKPYPLYGHPNTSEFCHCTTTVTFTVSSGTTVIGYPTNEPIVCPGYEALAARTEVPKAFYDAFEEE